MNLLSDVITYMRRILKTPSDSTIQDDLLIDYINRFWIMDVDARIQLFDLKTKYQFQTTPGVDQYNMPLYDLQIQPGNQPIASFPVYQGFLSPVRINGIEIHFETQTQAFWRRWPAYTQSLNPTAIGDGTAGPYVLNFPFLTTPPVLNNPQFIIRGHVDITGIIATGVNQDPPIVTDLLTEIPTTSTYPAVWITSTDITGANVVVADSGQFLSGNVNYGLLMTPGNAPYGNSALSGGYSITSNTVNYATGVATVTFPVAIPAGQNIQTECLFYELGIPREVLFYNNCLTFRNPPNTQYLVEIDAYLSPAAFFNTGSALPFGYMAEYIARGAVRKILSDTGDWDQFNAYESLFREQEQLVWKRSQRQWTATRTQTIYSGGQQGFFNTTGQGSV